SDFRHVFLRSVSIRGFKSFPDPVEVRLEPGVAVIVGPNGSGKSNVSDAIVWAAGSLSPRELRAERPDDVLYAGTANRPAADWCEVELLFDNADGDGPLEFSELSVVRRLHRGGEGEYLVNRARVRRTDVVELLADLGLAGEMHSIIGQGRVEEILASKPAERRALVEEAAGLGKFKRRRHRAELKLARVGTQVERARDLEDEVRKRLRPLALQATAAERAEKLGLEIEGLKARLAAAELERIERRLADVEERLATAGAERRRHDERLEGVLEERRRAEDGLAEAAGRHERATAALYRLRSALERLELRRERAEESAASLRAEADRPHLPSPPKPPSYERALSAAGAWAPEAVELSEAVARLEDAHAEGRDALVALSGGESWFAASGEAAAPEPGPPRRDGLLRELAGRSERLAELLAAAAARAARLEAPLQARVDAGGSRAGELGEELRRLGGWESELRRAAAEAAERVSAIGIERARLEAEREEVLRRLPEDAEAEPLSDEEADALRTQLERLARRREALGQVNPLAAEEHAREKARLEELTVQREDLERSLGELEGLRDELAETVERRFEETLSEVERHFAEVAGTLFPGGRGRLVRVEDEDGGEPGIEIELQPAGKRITRLSLLSGGEKALGAISFLFALFLARPCPFYVLDEVEAALDDANIARFTELLRRFSGRAQFVVVTHQKRTIEAADILYGVTMGADGISQIVSKRLDAEPAAQAQAASA
ncbi:MAG TPA: AAA family ATPase, partial [Gaiellaceae bacterium]|nr:AAA family ATPase [Gaiellaceae bacterium]